MTKAKNKELQTQLKKFKTGATPKGYKATFDNGITKEAIHSNDGKDCGSKIGDKDSYYYPQYIITKDDEVIFGIEASEDGIQVIGDSNSEQVSDWKQAFQVGLDYFKNGW